MKTMLAKSRTKIRQKYTLLRVWIGGKGRVKAFNLDLDLNLRLDFVQGMEGESFGFFHVVK